MRLLIDGYNLLNSVGVLPPPDRPAGLEQSRRALLDFLVARIPAEELSRTVIVFDAAGAPPGLPREFSYHGLAVRFSPRSSDADSVLEELIQADTAPRRMTVVSSDHRVQRAARRRRARAVDSDVWFLQLLRQARRQPETPHRAAPLLTDELNAWLAEFAEPLPGLPIDPFPPGYGEDLLQDDWGLPPK